jgi:hypothetical protein
VRVLVVQKTGWGKSVVYWLATRALLSDTDDHGKRPHRQHRDDQRTRVDAVLPAQRLQAALAPPPTPLRVRVGGDDQTSCAWLAA